jgi:hypothetical protein
MIQTKTGCQSSERPTGRVLPSNKQDCPPAVATRIASGQANDHTMGHSSWHPRYCKKKSGTGALRPG